ncbi:hypothetical protein E3N88_15598 [Mikania micrantha]|uniref:Uncharacterized protein n=1 Tax=Mikania micrantha TaxID=192012 RepID=A0A5N6NXA6_9ASTR|nr:hypothetical protein E3N88_15598 [Mikania micrantha]
MYNSEAVQVKGLQDDTTCIVIDILSPEKTHPPMKPSNKTNKQVFKAMSKKRSTEEPPKLDEEEEYFDPDLVEC